MSSPPYSADPYGRFEPRWKLHAYFALLLVGLHLIAGPKLRLSEWRVDPAGNAALEEALRWKEGSLELHLNKYDVAHFDGKRFNVVGLSFVLICLIGTTLTSWTGGGAHDFYPLYYVALVALPLAPAAYLAFRSQTHSSAWGAALAAYLICGTSLLHIVQQCRGAQGGSVNAIDQVLSVTGLLIFAGDLLGARRIWPAAIGLALSAWARPMTILYVLPLLWLVRPGPSTIARSRRSRWIGIAAVAFIAGVPMTLNSLKFGNPFQTGYRYLYEGRTDPVGRSGREQLFGLRYASENLRAMNLAFPSWDLRAGVVYPDTSNINGGSIWLTSPLLLGVFLTIPQWWRDSARRTLMLSTLPVLAGIACYHTTGAVHAGCFRYALDFIPIWLLVIAPFVTTNRAAPWTLGCLAYSALYFNLLP